MPINIADVQAAPAVKIYNPKFFDSKLTGRGGTSTIGLLSARNNPVAIPAKVNTQISHFMLDKKQVFTNGATTVTKLPVNTLSYDAWKAMKKIERPDLNDMVLIATCGKTDIYAIMYAHSLTIEETTISGGVNGGSHIDRTFTPCYQLQFFAIRNSAVKEHTQINDIYNLPIRTNQPENTFWGEYSSNPMEEFNTKIVPKFQSMNIKVDQKAFLDYLTAYDLYDAVTRRSEEWQTTIDKIIDCYFQNMKPLLNGIKQDHDRAMRTTECLVKYIMDYNIPLDLYRSIYQSLIQNFNAKDAVVICKQNLNLLLSDTLNNLNNNKSQLITFQPPTPAITMPASIQHLSPEQMRAVSSTEPLILVQAGAGTGKSTLILGRIDYLTACGVNPADITVLSFTNAAADHISEKNPNVHSMTIARMIHEIYTKNFTNHDLSSIDTIINSLDIYYPMSITKSTTTVATFKKRLYAIAKNEANNFTEMNNFIEEHYDEVIDILNTIRQTSLELEIIICYQKIDIFQEPASVQSKFLIIDEVQDNSIFEFVYTLKYIDKHKESMFIVGDCSQTLFEFRASNPRALNILESSGTFATYQLNVNYRSNQEILDFANVALQNIEANQYAKIQLQANSLARVTEQSFLDKVHFNYHRLNKIGDFSNALPSIFATEVKPYIDACLARGEQIAFLAFTRNDVRAIENILTHQFPGKVCTSLVPDKMHNTVIMSNFIKKYWNEIKFVPAAGIDMIITQEILSRLTYLVYDDKKALPFVQKLLTTWRTEESPNINTWVHQVQNGQITQDEFLTLIKENMLQFEIRNNAIKQALLSSQNEKNKQTQNIQNANFLLSTIHSAKGLEFDNVVVLYRNENSLAEDKKRMYYVAFTRAMKSEYILAYDVSASPQILADYRTILERLHDIAPAAKSPLDTILKNKRVKI